MRKNRFRVWLDAAILSSTAWVLAMTVIFLIVLGFYIDYNMASECIREQQKNGRSTIYAVYLCGRVDD